MTSIVLKPDTVGYLASTLCLIHCISTPFIFITQACTISCCAESPIWWQSLDYIFIIISFFAILRSTQTSSNKIIKILLWTTWLIFFISIMDKSMQLVNINNSFIYVTGLLLALLHLYNLKYCQCKNETCCSKKNNYTLLINLKTKTKS